MSEFPPPDFVETVEHRRFAEFSEACLANRYIGLCHGAPGVGKTLSARHHARWTAWDDTEIHRIPDGPLADMSTRNTAFWTAPVVSSPRSIEEAIRHLLNHMLAVARTPIERAQTTAVQARVAEFERENDRYFKDRSAGLAVGPKPEREYFTVADRFRAALKNLVSPTRLIIVDEADRLKVSGLEALRDLFDHGEFGLVLIGMPGMEKRMARYAQLYSRIGFVHEFRPLQEADVSSLLVDGWRPDGVDRRPIETDAIAAVQRITGGNFRLLQRVLTQSERIAEINALETITASVVETARDTLVIGQT